MNKARMLLAVGAVGVIVAGGSAFTDAITFTQPSHVVGYGTQTVTGATASNVAYTLSTDGTTIDKVVVTLAADATGEVATADLSGTAGTCSISTVTVTCTFTGATTASTHAFNLSVS